MFFNFFKFNFTAFFPEIFIITQALFLLLFGVFLSNSKKQNFPFLTKELSYLTSLIFFFSLLLIINNPFLNLVTFNYLLITDGFTFFIKILFLIATICCLLTSISYLIKEKISMYEYSILLLFATAGALCFVSSYDLLSVYLAIEIQSLSFYILTTLRINSSFSTEAGLKYFILGALSSGFLLFGISLIYGIIGTLNFEALAKFILNFDYGLLYDPQSIFHFEYTERLILGLVFIMAGFFFKMAAAPFHF